MKLMFASDIHGSASCCRAMLDAFRRENAARLILLGDLLYHGPRNDIPEGYSPKETAAMLNENSAKLLCVRGNCEAEVDQMMLTFPAMADYAAVLTDNGRTIFCTHGHLYPDGFAGMNGGDVLITGHTHIFAAEKRGEVFFVNTGSVTLPKNGNPKSYAVYENDTFRICTMDGSVLAELTLT